MALFYTQNKQFYNDLINDYGSGKTEFLSFGPSDVGLNKKIIYDLSIVQY
jgi:hypothetical protein